VCFCVMTSHNLVVGTGVEEHTSAADGLLKIHIVCTFEALITIYQTAIMNLHMFAPCINSIKPLLIIPPDAHDYKIIGMLKTIKILTVAPTCFGSRRNHHQGAILCLAKTTIMILLCLSLMTWSMLWRHTSLLCKHAVHGRGSPSKQLFPSGFLTKILCAFLCSSMHAT